MDTSALSSALDSLQIEYSLDYPMSKLTTFKIGGPADVLITPKSREQLSSVLSLCTDMDVPYMIIGKGSNLLISDDGMDGAVIKLSGALDEIKLIDETTVYCGAGAQLSALCTFCCEHSLSGLEFAFGIPGSVGGAVFMNAGAYGGEMRDVVTDADYVSPDGEFGRISDERLDFSYRHSAFSNSANIIVGAVFKLKRDDKTAIKARMDDFMSRRKDKQPLQYPSAGSTFKRPEGYFAGALIEQSGLKGYSIGGAEVSEKHAGFVINKGGATCKDVSDLMKHIADTVFEKFGVRLEAEVIKRGR